MIELRILGKESEIQGTNFKVMNGTLDLVLLQCRAREMSSVIYSRSGKETEVFLMSKEKIYLAITKLALCKSGNAAEITTDPANNLVMIEVQQPF